MAATRNSWKQIAFTSGTPIRFEASYAKADFAKLREGLIPEVMEDKWFVFYEDPHLFLHRSWTGAPAYRVTLAETGVGAAVTEALYVPDAGQNNSPEDAAALLDFLIGNLLLGQSKPFPLPPGARDDRPGLLQHVIAGTGFPQTGAPRRRFWWWPRQLRW
jgi:hypothetical protein